MPKPLVLIAEDDEVNLQLLTMRIEQLGYATIQAEHGQKAVDLIRDHQPDLIMLDVLMPVKDGIAACREILQQDGMAHVPVMMVAALGEEELVEQAFDAGASDYIVKPINMAVLRNRVKRLIEAKLARDELQYTQDLLNHVLVSAPVYLYVMDTKANLTLVKGDPPATLNLPHEADGSSLFERWANFPLLLNDLQKALDGFSDMRLLHIDSQPMQIWNAPLYGRHGELLGVMGTGHQLPDEEWQNNAVMEHQRRLQTLISNLPGMVYRSHHEPEWRMDYVSEGSTTLTGYTPADLIGNHKLSFVDIIYPEDWERILPTIQTALDNNDAFEVTFRITTRDGQERWIWERGRCVPPKRGQGAAIEGFMIDITDKQAYEAALYNERNLLRTVIDNLPDYIFAKNTDGVYRVSNWAHAKHVGLDHPKEVIGKTDYDFYDKERAESFDFDDRSIMTLRQPMVGYELTTQDRHTHEQKWYSITKVPLISPDTQEMQGVVGMIRDITRRKMAEDRMKQANTQLQELSDLKSNFLLTISHELRTPLNSIVGYVDLLLTQSLGALNEVQADRLERVARNSRQLREMIDDILDISKIQTGTMPIDLQALALADIVDGLLPGYQKMATDKGVTLQAALPPNLPKVHVDNNALHKILDNLLSNAIKFTKAGMVSVEATALSDAAFAALPDDVKNLLGEQDGQWVQVSVRDTGSGISAEVQSKIFDTFRQGDNSTTRIYGGSGLGLALCRHLTQLLNGAIWMDSTLGVGSTFYILLPAAP